MRMQVTLRNEYHGSEVQVAIMGRYPYTLTAAQAAKVRRHLCGQRGCACGVVRGRATDVHGVEVAVCPDGLDDGRGTWTIDSA
jgi:hypothetical protein